MRTGHHAVANKNVLPTVIVDIGEVGTPRPASFGDSRVLAHIAKCTVAHVLEQCVASRMALVHGSRIFIDVLAKLTLVRDSISRRRKHVADVEIGLAV